MYLIYISAYTSRVPGAATQPTTTRPAADRAAATGPAAAP